MLISRSSWQPAAEPTRHPSETQRATDGIFGDDGATTQMATVTGDVASGYTITLSMGVDTTTEAGGGTTGGPPPRGGVHGDPSAPSTTS